MILTLSDQSFTHLLSVLTDAQKRLIWRAGAFRDDSRTQPSVLAYLDDIIAAVADTREQLQRRTTP